MKDICISVIVPVYNVEHYLEMCIESIIHQQYTNLEIILVDDGSTDRSGEICDIYAKLDKRIRVIHKENGGLSDARNVGMQQAHGQLIGFVDSDDWIDPNMYLELYNAMSQSNSEIAICNRILVQGNQYIYDEGDGGIHVLDQQSALNLLLDNTRCPSHAWNKLYKKEVFNDILFPVNKYYEDVYIMHLIFEKAKNIAFIEKPLYYYRQRETSIVHMKNLKGYYELLEAVELRYNRYRDNELFSVAIAKNMLQVQLASLELLNLLDLNKKEKKKFLSNLKNYYNECCRDKLSELPIRSLIKRKLWLTFPVVVKLLHASCFKPFRVLLRKLMNKQSISCNDKNTIMGLQNMNNKKRVILMGSPEGSNLGDLAIAYSMQRYINKYFPEVDFYEISERFILYYIKKIKHLIHKDDVLLLIGGGNFGDLYMDQQKIRKLVLKNFSHNKIVQFPQSWLFTETKHGKLELKKTYQLLKKNQSITIFAREKISYNLFVEHFQHMDIRLVPDIVLSNIMNTNSKKEGILVCLRGDIESRLDVQTRLNIINICTQYGKVECWDTVVPKTIMLDKRNEEVVSGINYVARHKVMVTDRFHGIIFAAITGTPCIAISNNNQKITGLIEILDTHSIQLLSDIQQLSNLVSDFIKKYPDGSQKQITKLNFHPLQECLASAFCEKED